MTTNKYRYILRPAQYTHSTGVVIIQDSLYVHEKLIWSKMFQTEQLDMSAAIFRCWEYQFEGSIEIERSTSHNRLSHSHTPLLLNEGRIGYKDAWLNDRQMDSWICKQRTSG